MNISTGHKWRPIADYECPPTELARTELRDLWEVWNEQAMKVGSDGSGALKNFNEKLKRAWAIETGLIERVYTLDRGVTRILIERGIDAALIPHGSGNSSPQKTIAIINDHREAVEGLFAFVKGNRELSVSYIKELHDQLTNNQEFAEGVDPSGKIRNVPLLRGEFKKQANNPLRPDGLVHEYCPPEHVSSEMDNLIEMHKRHENVDPEVESAWLHHRFTQIHPFQDGNGRVARCLATLVFIKEGLFPLVIRDITEERIAYLDALEEADRGKLAPLVGVFFSFQKKMILQALEVASRMPGDSTEIFPPARGVAEIINAAGEKLRKREEQKREEWKNAQTTAELLHDCAKQRLENVRESLEREINGEFSGDNFGVDDCLPKERDERGHYFRRQIIETAKTLDYFANPRIHHSWLRLKLRIGGQSEILISFHGKGHEYHGLLVCSVCFFHREETEEGERQVSEAIPLVDDGFQINYHENADAAKRRFEGWLEIALSKGLDLWRAGL